MRILTGDECGILKESIPELSRSNDGTKDSQLSVNLGVSRLGGNSNLQMSRSRGVVGLSFCQLHSSDEDADTGCLSFCALRADGSIEKWEGFSPYNSKEDRICGGTYKLSKTLNGVFDEEKNDETSGYRGRPVAMVSAHKNQVFCTTSTPRNIVACCSSTGLVSVVNANNIEKGVVARYHAYSKGNRSKPSTISYTKGEFLNRDTATSLAMSIDAQKLVVGGRERAATLIDVETGKQIWKAKNLPPNPQTLLQQPIWSTAIEFLSKSDTVSKNSSSDLLAVGTAYKQLQIYDIRSDATQRRPILYTPEWDSTKKNILEHRVTSLCQLDSNRIVVGDSAGYMHTLDLRKICNKTGRSLSASVGRFNGPAGSVRQILKHETLPVIACVGMDRMMRTFDINKRKQLDCVFLKQRLNCMLFCSDGTWNNQRSEGNDSSEEDSEEENEMGSIEGNINDEDKVQDYVDSSESEGDEQYIEPSVEQDKPKTKRPRKE